MKSGRDRPVRPAALSLAVLGGAIYAGAEALRQIAVPSPAGVPGDSGVSPVALLSLGLLFTTAPAVLASLPFGGAGRRAQFAVLSAAAWPFATAGSWRALDRAGVLLEAPQWTPPHFLLPGLLLAALGALCALPVVRVWPARWRLSRRGAALVALAGAVGVVLQLPRTPAPASGEGDGPNLLLVTIDTLRRDGLARYGGSWPTALDSIGGVAHEGWSVCSWTQPAMASLFSAVVPTGHGSDRQHGPDPAVSWWPESLSVGGRESAAFVTNPYLRRRFGFDRGFGYFDHAEERPWLEPVARTVLAEYLQAWINSRPGFDRAATVVGRATEWLEARDSSASWFLWVHLLDPHLPYTLRGSGGRPDPGKVPGWSEPLRGWYEDGGFEDLQAVRSGTAIVSEPEREALRRLYQTEVDYAAWWTRELVQAAERASRSSELVWVVTSDHGEEFFDEGGFEHGHTLADAVLRVPLLATGLSDSARVLRLIDVGPMILRRLDPGTSFDPERATALLESDTALLPFAVGGPTLPPPCDRPVMLAEGLLYGEARTRFTLRDGRVVERDDLTGSMHRVGGCPEGVSPPGTPPWQELDLWRERRGNSPVTLEVDDDLRRRLRAIGYVH